MISVTIIVKNGEKLISSVLEPLQAFDEVLLYDTGSTDKTVEIAQSFDNVTIHTASFAGFGKAHNEAAKLAKHDWILSIDADEVLSNTLLEELQNLKLERGTVYSLPFQNFYRKKRVYIWDPESHIRLYNKQETSFTEAKVHEGVKTCDLRVVSLKGPVYHYSYGSISDFLTKMERYSSLFAEQNMGRASSPFTAVVHSSAAFLKNYFLKRGFLGGYPGFLISMYMAHTAFYKYMKLYEAQC